MNDFQQIGTVAAEMVDRWQWWRDALAGKIGPIHDGHPEQGYYRVRRKGEPWEPVAIFYPDGSDELVAYRAGKEVRPEDIWTWACRTPITFEAYQKAIGGGGFDDEPPAPTVGHNSGSDDPFDAIRQELLGEIETASEFVKAEITSQAAADKAGVWAKRFTDLSKRADNHRTVEKEPHLAASRAVDDKWRDPITEAKEWATKLKRHLEPFLIAEKRKAEEARRKAQEEAERQRREALRASNEEQRVAALKAADEADKAAETRNASAGRTGARVSVRVEKIGVVTDYGKAAAALVSMNHADFLAEIDRFAQRAAKSGMAFDGMEIRGQERVV